MRNLSIAVLLVVISITLIGCGQNPQSGPFGPPRASALMTPFSGSWSFEFDKTLAAQKAAGATDDQISQIRKMYADNPALGKMHSDLKFDGNTAVGAGLISSEYRFFAMHKHGKKTCGKAWHHEDRFDPGDMSKHPIRLEVLDDLLYLEVGIYQ